MKRKDRIRVTIDLTRSQYDRLSLLEEKTEAVAKAEVIRQALKLYEYVINRSEHGDVIIARGEGGKEETLIFLEESKGR